MQGNSRESTPQDLWKAQEDGAVTMASDEVRARANRYERESVLVYRVTLGLTPLFLFLFIYNLARLSGPLLLAGTGLALAAYCLIAWKVLRGGPHRSAPAEPCLDYLRREFDQKRRGLLWVRGCVLLLAPAVLVSWWGGAGFPGQSIGHSISLVAGPSRRACALDCDGRDHRLPLVRVFPTSTESRARDR